MSSPRAALIADTAIALLAERGSRGLTHRAVDEAAGLPPGTTSNHARSRAALLAATLDRITELETQAMLPGGPPTAAAAWPAPGSSPRAALAALLAHALEQALGPGRTLTLARFELALEATRRPELRAVYDRLGADFLVQAAQLLTFAGSPAPQQHAGALIRWCEGVLFYSVAGAGQDRAPGRDELRAEAEQYLTGLLGPA
ncbi:TetR/AcrR family transcriptional regulator [Kitasatospora sp. LaBMicrA B282]|uniref:TetR/AcrR family transcriptional regulator n=1 Tax=Kitasatospora sp. LaBMicrA B282 TaxID=3420949 RepID=UPI003D1464FB